MRIALVRHAPVKFSAGRWVWPSGVRGAVASYNQGSNHCNRSASGDRESRRVCVHYPGKLSPQKCSHCGASGSRPKSCGGQHLRRGCIACSSWTISFAADSRLVHCHACSLAAGLGEWRRVEAQGAAASPGSGGNGWFRSRNRASWLCWSAMESSWYSCRGHWKTWVGAARDRIPGGLVGMLFCVARPIVARPRVERSACGR